MKRLDNTINANINIPHVGLLNLSRETYNQYYYFDYNNIYDNNYNIYNVCYMNSCIQCLFHLNKFTDFILESTGKNLIRASKNLLLGMKENKKNLSVSEIKNAMSEIDERYKQNNQEDANEFISIYLDGLFGESADKINLVKMLHFDDIYDNNAYENFYNKFYLKKGSSPILKLFYGILKYEKICNFCKSKISIRFSSYNMIELPIYDLAKNNKNKTLELTDIFNNYLEKYRNKNEICPYCKYNNEIYNKNYILTFPKYLIFYFGRTVGNEYINNDIHFYDAIFENHIFKLKGVVYYLSFGYKSGHYTALCECGNEWYYFDDNIAQKKEKPEVGKAILLFYKIKK